MVGHAERVQAARVVPHEGAADERGGDRHRAADPAHPEAHALRSPGRQPLAGGLAAHAQGLRRQLRLLLPGQGSSLLLFGGLKFDCPSGVLWWDR